MRRILLIVVAAVLLGSCLTAFALYTFNNVTIPFRVTEPLEVIDYPTSLNLYPGDTIHFNVSILNHAENYYAVSLNLSLNDASYQHDFTRFSNTTGVCVAPGSQDLDVWVHVASDAPAANMSLTVSVLRLPEENEKISITNTQFGGSGTGKWIGMTVWNYGAMPVTIIEVWINSVKQVFTPGTVQPNSGILINVTYTWINGYNYAIKLVTSKGNMITYTASVPSP